MIGHGQPGTGWSGAPSSLQQDPSLPCLHGISRYIDSSKLLLRGLELPVQDSGYDRQTIETGHPAALLIVFARRD